MRILYVNSCIFTIRGFLTLKGLCTRTIFADELHRQVICSGSRLYGHWAVQYVHTSGFWPRVRARLFGLSNTPNGALRAPLPSQLRCSPKNKNSTISRYKNLSLLARTWAARGVYFSTGLSCILLS
jgi:hypothetical protein